MLTLGEAAGRLAVSARTVRREIAAGRLAVVRIGRALRICETDLEAYILRSRTLEKPEGLCLSKNVVTLGAYASKSAVSKLAVRLAKARPTKTPRNTKRNSVASLSGGN